MVKKSRPVVIQYPNQQETYEVASEAVAKKVHPDAKIVGYAGTFLPYGETPPEGDDTPVQHNLSGIPPKPVAPNESAS